MFPTEAELSTPMTTLCLRESKTAHQALFRLAAEDRLGCLVSLNLEYADISDSTLAIVGDGCSTSLTRLNLNACQALTDHGLFHLRRLTNLTEIGLYWNVKIGDEGVESITRANHGLKKLSLSGCKHVTDEGVTSIATCKYLDTLDLTRCAKISDAGLEHIAKHCPSLRILLLYACSGFGDKGVHAVTSSLHRLEILDVCGTGKLTDSVSIPTRR